tara:strand:+ start:395 stop:613 length:219 start_codon:yes stop_codon:yes gene_type:complete
MAFNLAKFKTALGKKRFAKVADVLDDGYVLQVELHNGAYDLWEYAYDEFTFAEIVAHAKQFIDNDGVGGAGE